MQIGNQKVDKIMLGTDEVTKVMLGNDQVHPIGSGFAITQHPANKSGLVGGPVFTLTVGYTPPKATVQWQWRNPTENKPDFQNVTGATGDSYTMYDSGSGLTAAQNDDRFRAVVSLDGVSLNSNEAMILVDYGDTKPLTGDSDAFLRIYTPTDPRYGEDEKLYPRGRRMSIWAWTPQKSGPLVAPITNSWLEMKNAGFTALGPWNPELLVTDGHSPSTADFKVEAYRDYGLRCIIKLRDIYAGGRGANWTERVMDLYNNDRAKLLSNIHFFIDGYKQKFIDAFGNADAIEGWDNPLEETRYDGANIQAASKYVNDEVLKYDGGDRFIQQPESTGASVDESWVNNYYETVAASFEKQQYINQYLNQNSVATSRMQYKAQISWLRAISDNHPTTPFYNHRKIVSMLFGTEFPNPGDKITSGDVANCEEDSQDLADREISSDVLQGLNAGLHMISWYTWNNVNTTNSKYCMDGNNQNIATIRRRQSILDFMGAVTPHGLPEVFLWGQRKSDITSNVSTRFVPFQTANPGNPTSQEVKYYSGHNHFSIAAKIDYANIQLKDERFIPITNISHSSQGFTLSGFPKNGQSVAEVVFSTTSQYTQGQIVSLTSGKLTMTLDALESVVFKVRPADGYHAT